MDSGEVRDVHGQVLTGPHKHLRILERRRAYLNNRIERGKREGKDLMYDEYERDALEWAIDTLYGYIEEH